MQDLKKTFIFAAVGQTGYQNRKQNTYISKLENPIKSIGASFTKISLIEPEIFKVKEWFQVKVPTPLCFQYFHIFLIFNMFI